MVNDDVCRILTRVLGLGDAGKRLGPHTQLLGTLPEFDSMAVVSVLTAVEEHYGISIDDDEVEASIFETVASLSAFVSRKIAA